MLSARVCKRQRNNQPSIIIRWRVLTWFSVVPTFGPLYADRRNERTCRSKLLRPRATLVARNWREDTGVHTLLPAAGPARLGRSAAATRLAHLHALKPMIGEQSYWSSRPQGVCARLLVQGLAAGSRALVGRRRGGPSIFCRTLRANRGGQRQAAVVELARAQPGHLQCFELAS